MSKEKVTIEKLMIESYNEGHMCKGCLALAMSPFNIECPIHSKVKK